MGRKISVDSATLVNKGLELAEACWLFDRKPEEIEVVVHPQSIVHSMIRYVDGSVLAQMGKPDMRTPIAYSLSWPDRIDAGVSPLDMVAVGRLDFEAPDLDAFPCLRLAYESIRVAGGMCVFSAANEIAVDAFLGERIRYRYRSRHPGDTGEHYTIGTKDIATVIALDESARQHATEAVASISSGRSTH